MIDLPPIGTAHPYNGQAYTYCGETRDHVARAGHTVILHRWTAICRECGDTFDAWLSTARPTKFAKRRCNPCAAKSMPRKFATPADRIEHHRERARLKSQRARDRKRAAK